MCVKRLGKLAPALAVLAFGCTGRAADAVGPNEKEEAIVAPKETNQTPPARSLPFAHGQSFATLDEYLAHLRDRAGPIGQPWYRKLDEDRYELVTNMRPAGEPQIFTRAQLLERFGFDR